MATRRPHACWEGLAQCPSLESAASTSALPQETPGPLRQVLVQGHRMLKAIEFCIDTRVLSKARSELERGCQPR